MLHKLLLVGVGTIGKRHFESILRIKKPLSITVVDSSASALKKARTIPNTNRHKLSFVREIPSSKRIDLAIIATTSAHRASAVKELLSKTKKVRYLLLEKILFDRKEDYSSIGKLLKKHGVKTWVNHPRCLYPFHRSLLQKIHKKPFLYHIHSGERDGLMTNATHYAYYCAFLAGSTDFKTDTSLLLPKLIKSKRKGYFELYGTLVFRFKNGATGIATSLPQTAPRTAELVSPAVRVAFDEIKGEASISEKHKKWLWKKEEAPILFQSDMTGPLVEEILRSGKCGLPDYETSAKVHLKVLEPIRRFLSLSSYPFT